MAGSATKIIIMIVIIIVIIVVGIVIYKYQSSSSQSSSPPPAQTSNQSSTESFTTTSMEHIGGLEDYPKEYFNTSAISSIADNSYQLIPPAIAPEGGAYKPLLTDKYSSSAAQTSQGLDRVDDKLIPTTVANVTPYDVDVADPQFYIYQVQAPRVIKKDPQAMLA